MRTDLQVCEGQKLTMTDQGRHVVLQSNVKELVQPPRIDGVAIPLEGVVFPNLR